MNEILCIDDLFPKDCLEFYKLHGVLTPDKDKIYNIRDVIRHSTGVVGILLEELINPKVPIEHPVLGVTNMEPTWANKRFAHLDKGEITMSELNELLADIKKNQKAKL